MTPPPPLKSPSQDLLEPPRQSHRRRLRSPCEIGTQPSLPIATSMLKTPSSDRPRYLRPSDMVTTPLKLYLTSVAWDALSTTVYFPFERGKEIKMKQISVYDISIQQNSFHL
ncbi:hypothetical protein TIFTF001_002650 [Ficus carica]|uniref:Uncharacterized protein n=1 Tax=Ficus carica TaxID=3494 RepID=A0AA87ZNP4_FICCA|nr:hypothetical protein TIFTF001_002650 [Ficus carica]